MSGIERIAILGANSQIALDYIELSLEKTYREHYLFSRNPINLEKLVDRKYASKFKLLGYEEFESGSFDLVINFVGGSDPALISQMGKDIFTITDQYDLLAINYLKKNNQCKYIFISSGAAYGEVFSKGPASELTRSNFNFDSLTAANYYGAAKYLAEQRHRALSGLNIVDVRIFSYISKRQNLESKLFLPELITAIKNNTEFLTSDEEMWRDYIGSEDLYHFLECAIRSFEVNDSFDCFSHSPMSKQRLLDAIAKDFDLRVLILKSGVQKLNSKIWYYSINKRAESIGYLPKNNSLEIIYKTIASWERSLLRMP